MVHTVYCLPSCPQAHPSKNPVCSVPEDSGTQRRQDPDGLGTVWIGTDRDQMRTVTIPSQSPLQMQESARGVLGRLWPHDNAARRLTGPEPARLPRRSPQADNERLEGWRPLFLVGTSQSPQHRPTQGTGEPAHTRHSPDTGRTGSFPNLSKFSLPLRLCQVCH